jgi:hypothetical protein
VFSALLAVRLTLQLSTVDFAAKPGLVHVLGLSLIVTAGWCAATALLAIEDVAENRYRIDVPDNRRARRIRTQVIMLRRVTIVGIVVITAGLLLMTFPQVRTLGASVLASAGLIGVVAALAAQSLLANVFAGLQLTFSDAIRIDDVVVVEDQWCRVEEITLSHVVLHIWDDRRLILPTSYFTSKPYQNWTRDRAEVLGTIEFDLDWSVPVPLMRQELHDLVSASELWDGRTCVLQVTDSVRGTVRLRALVSAADAPTLWDLRCLVREHMVAWVRDHRPSAMPRTRAELAQTHDWPWARSQSPSPSTVDEPHARLFGGSEDGDARAQAFTGPESPHVQVLEEQAALDELDTDHVTTR